MRIKKFAKWAWILSTKNMQKRESSSWEKRCHAKFSKSKYLGSNDRGDYIRNKYNCY